MYIPNNDFQLHYHNFETDIICRTQLENILYFCLMENEYNQAIYRNMK